MEYEKVILLCRDNLEGILTGVYDGWKLGSSGRNVEIETEEPEYPELFCTFRTILPDSDKAVKVARSVQRKLGTEVYETICYAAASGHSGKGTAIFRVLQKALGHGACRRDILEELTDPSVHLVSALRIKVWHEVHRFYGFVRFREIGGTVLFAQIRPENDILEMLAPHFSNRFPNENWMIYDIGRTKVLIHKKGEDCAVHTGAVLSEKQREILAQPEEFEQLWKAFCTTVTIQERKNPQLQRQLLPFKFRSNMLEFDKNGIN